MSAANAGRVERWAIATGVGGLALFNIFVTLFRAPFSGFGQTEDIVPMDAINGSRFGLVLLGMVMLTVVPALWHGKRSAWGLALACALLSAALHPLKNIDLWGTMASATLVGALLGGRTLFRARSDPPTARRGTLILVFGVLVVFVYGVLGVYLLDREFAHATSIWESLTDTVRLMFLLPATQAQPRTPHGAWFIDSVRVAMAAALVIGVAHLLQPVMYRGTRRQERAAVRALLERYGDSSLAFFALLPDKAYFIAESGDAVLAYRVIRSTAVVMGDPIGNPSRFADLVAAFSAHCALNGWALAFHQATGRHLDLYHRAGLKALKIGEEAIVPVEEFSLAGHTNKHLRSTMNRFEHDGYRAELLYPPHGAATIARLRAVSDAWLAQDARRERTFTLGSFDEGMLQECPVMAARDPDGSIVGFANIIPSYRSRDGNFDMLRYTGEPKGIADFLYVSLIGQFRQAGYQGMNLGLAPFSGIDDGSPRTPASVAMQMMFKHGTILFRYRGLREYKAKFHPRWEARYLVYSSELQLPGIALAVARAGELHGQQRWDRDAPPTNAAAPALGPQPVA